MIRLIQGIRHSHRNSGSILLRNFGLQTNQRTKIVLVNLENEFDRVQLTYDEKNKQTLKHQHSYFQTGTVRLKNSVRRAFLPANYPRGFKQGYFKFSLYTTLANGTATLMSMLSTQAMFLALGSSSTQATMAASALSWVLKDGIGQFGGIMFSSLYGHVFEENIKKWRLNSYHLFNLGILFDICTLLQPSLFLLISSTGCFCKNLAMLAQGATRMPILVNFSSQNIADLTTKNTSQFIASSLIGVATGALISRFFDLSNFFTVSPLVFGIIILNQIFVRISLSEVVVNSLNTQKLSTLLEPNLKFFQSQSEFKLEIQDAETYSLKQKYWRMKPFDSTYPHQFVFCDSFKLLQNCSEAFLNQINQIFLQKPYFIITQKKSRCLRRPPYQVIVCLKHRAKKADILEAVTMTLVLNHRFERRNLPADSGLSQMKELVEVFHQKYPLFLHELKHQHWLTNRLHMHIPKLRFDFE